MLKQNCANHIDVNIGEIVDFLKGRRGQISLAQYLYNSFSLLPPCATSRASRIRNLSTVFQKPLLEAFVDHKGALEGWKFYGHFLDEVLNVLDLDTWTIFEAV